MTDGRDFTPGTLVADKYEIQSVLGRGGSATVYLAHRVDNGTKVALKVMHEGLPDGVGERERFAREVALVEQLRHPHIVRLLDYGYTDGDMPFLAFALLVGRSLDQRLREDGGLEWLEVGRLSAQVLRALDKAHSLGIVHRDIKPANIYLVRTPVGEVAQVLDFGLAKTVGQQADEQLTRVGSVLGTPRYLSPEQARGESVGPAADIYSFGLVMAEMLSGKPVVEGATHFEMFVHHGSDAAHELPLEVLDTPFAAIIRRAIDKVPSVRYRLANQMLVDVEAALERLEAWNEDEVDNEDEGDFIVTKMLDPSQAVAAMGEGSAASEQLRRAFNLLARKSRPGAKSAAGAASNRPSAPARARADDGNLDTAVSPPASARPTRRPVPTPLRVDAQPEAAPAIATAGPVEQPAIEDPDSEPEPATCVADFDMLGLAAGAPAARPQALPAIALPEPQAPLAYAPPHPPPAPANAFHPAPLPLRQPPAHATVALPQPQPPNANPLMQPQASPAHSPQSNLPTGMGGGDVHTVLFDTAGWPPAPATTSHGAGGALASNAPPDLGATAYLPTDEPTFEPLVGAPEPARPMGAGASTAAFASGGGRPSSAWASIPPPPTEPQAAMVANERRSSWGLRVLLVVIAVMVASAVGAAVRLWLWR